MIPRKGKRTVVSSTKIKSSSKTHKSINNKQHSPLQRLFAKQQAKLRTTTRTSKLLKLYSDGSHVNIAKLIQTWLSEQS